MIITAYFDESGTHDGSPTTVMGGLMANERQWSRFESGLKALKKKHGFKIFHTKKFTKRTGDFKGWSDTQCMALVHDLAQLTRKGLMESVTFPLDNESYDTHFRNGDVPRRVRLDSKYGLCFRVCMYHLIREVMRRAANDKDHALHVVMERGHENLGDAHRIFYEVKADFDQAELPLLKTFTSATKEECDQLMIADVLAHTTYQMDLSRRAGEPQKPMVSTPGKSSVMHLSMPTEDLQQLKRSLIEDALTKRRNRLAR